MSLNKLTRARAQESLTPVVPPASSIERVRKTSMDVEEGVRNADVIDVSVPSVSGMFIDLDERGLLGEFRGLVQRLTRLDDQLRKANAELKQINDPEWVLRYVEQVRRQQRNFRTALEQRASARESRKKKLLSEKVKVEDRIHEIAPGMKIPELKALLPEIPLLDQGNRDPGVSERNRLIRELAQAGMSNRDICRRLDLELGQHGEDPSRGLPDLWFTEYRISTYLAAYQDEIIGSRLQTIISKAKKGRS